VGTNYFMFEAQLSFNCYSLFFFKGFIAFGIVLKSWVLVRQMWTVATDSWQLVALQLGGWFWGINNS